MAKTILDYQIAFNKTVESLKVKKEVLALFVFGSIMNGDLWEQSDIDLIVVYNEPLDNINNIYTEHNDIPIHIKLIDKKKFISLCIGANKGGYIHRLFSSSKLVFSNDKDIDELYDKERFFNDFCGERWNMVFLSDLLKSTSECKKYLYKESIYNAYTLASISIREYAKLIVNFSGYMINRDVVNMAMNLDSKLSTIAEEFFMRKNDIKKDIEILIEYIDDNINRNMKVYTSLLLNYMKEINTPLSSREIAFSKLFREYKINMEEILNKLYELEIVNKMKRPYKSSLGNILIEENVYYI
ncbi:nucleotidyltransferase domain-containing protein [Hathewaya limosa]|uniref:Nucleotidyltransferase n=1 Tax=Hathewaya limosa TaxID=1536 RepID=A0ABU0JUC9_HATLI|nr:nucleotidyltransferase domain-containing protein [Hathewaya limosa]MDQ0479664.1 putative nucleotidyltransferase [Hathewaya limosa]